MKSSKSPFKAFLMSCLVQGWGFFYIGQTQWALLAVTLLYGGALLVGLSGLLASPTGMFVLGGFIIVAVLAPAITAARLARHYKGRANTPRVRLHVLYVVSVCAISITLISLSKPYMGYGSYSVPGSSMLPTVAAGDYIVSDTRAAPPTVGDIVVFRHAGTLFILRVAGVGNDILAIVNGDLIRNGENLGTFHARAGAKETYSLDLTPVRVEPGHVYLLGDNRDYSNDSRFMGQVNLENVVGKVTGIWFSKEWSRIGTKFP